VEKVCYGGGKLVRREGKLRENNYEFCDFFVEFL
jgi:hypothetical protein